MEGAFGFWGEFVLAPHLVQNQMLGKVGNPINGLILSPFIGLPSIIDWRFERQTMP